MTHWIALTGGIGSGKSQVAAYFAELGVPIIDADAVNRQLISTPNGAALQQIAAIFGCEALDECGCLNRSYIRDLIFHDHYAKVQLETVLHPHIITEIRRLQSEISAVYGLVEVPTLYENPHFQSLVQSVLLVCADENKRIERVHQRSGFSLQQTRAIMNQQASDIERLTIANNVIHNNGSLADLQQAVWKLNQKFRQLFRES